MSLNIIYRLRECTVHTRFPRPFLKTAWLWQHPGTTANKTPSFTIPPPHTHTHSQCAHTLSLRLFYSLKVISDSRVLSHLLSSSLSGFARTASIPGDKWSAGVLSDPWFHQAGAFALGSGSGGRRSVARPPIGTARRPQWPRNTLRGHSAPRLRTLSGTRCDLGLEGSQWSS